MIADGASIPRCERDNARRCRGSIREIGADCRNDRGSDFRRRVASVNADVDSVFSFTHEKLNASVGGRGTGNREGVNRLDAGAKNLAQRFRENGTLTEPFNKIEFGRHAGYSVWSCGRVVGNLTFDENLTTLPEEIKRRVNAETNKAVGNPLLLDFFGGGFRLFGCLEQGDIASFQTFLNPFGMGNVLFRAYGDKIAAANCGVCDAPLDTQTTRLNHCVSFPNRLAPLVILSEPKFNINNIAFRGNIQRNEFERYPVFPGKLDYRVEKPVTH
ncbi:hypothetical protein FF38_14041 [Lucilia cuprina]|uniref:Uncharacterized protein n=1 Tax=Lucilia cuprina TaxID=7375 RepID=A0A0L0BNW8_LUCCU|nr:hypothetical protein FF38_14041 [Lucilia cuprina]